MKKFYIYKIPSRSKNEFLPLSSDVEEIIDSIDNYCSGFFYRDSLISDKRIKEEHLLLFPIDIFGGNLSRPIKLSFSESFVLRELNDIPYWPLTFAYGFGKRFPNIKNYGEGLYQKLIKSR